jgi:hypothetical protein
MAQHDYIIANQSGAAFRSDLNNGLAAIVSQNSGAAQPSTTYAYQWWADTTTGLLKLRNAANNAWITIGTLADANLGLLSLAGGTLTGALLLDDSGTVSAPALAFDGDTNTGIWRSAADTLNVATNGVENLEFGTTEVVFNDGGADIDFRVEGDTNANLFKIDAGLDEVQVANLNGGALAGFRNRIINGDFDFWQRGTSFSVTSTGTFTTDRWQCVFDGSGATRTISRQSFTLGQTDVLNEPTYFARYAQTVAGSGATFNNFEQRIENVSTFAGRQVTISFYAKAATSFTLPKLTFAQGFGTGGSPSATVFTDFAVSTTIATSFAKYSYTVNIPSISGKTLGSDNNDFLSVIFSLPINTTFTVDIAQVQIEPGSVATPFERRPFGTELALCQRYYQELTRVGWRGDATTGEIYAAWYNHSTMRVAPSVAISDVSLSGFAAGVAVVANGASYIQAEATCNSTGANRFWLANVKLSAEL